MYEKTIINNGLTVASHFMPNRRSASLGIWVRAGSRYENERISGISHFLEHLVFKGTEKRNCEELKQAIEGIGGSLNAFTSEEVTCYYCKVPDRHLDVSLEVLWDMVLNARLAAKDIEMERKVILEEIRMYKDLPGHYVSELLVALLWPNQPLGMNIAGESKSVTGISQRQLRDFRDRFYRLNNIAVVACGNIKHKRVLERCRDIMPGSGSAKKNTFTRARVNQKRPQTHFTSKETEQTHLALGVHGVPRTHPDRFTLGLIHVILGANMSSRLFREVREERGLAYEIGTGVKFFDDTGAFVVHAGIDNKRVEEAMEVILSQLRVLKEEDIGKEELKRAKEYYTGQLTLALENTSDHMVWLGESLLRVKRTLTPAQTLQRIRKVSAGDIKRLARSVFHDGNLNCALIGPLNEKKKRQIKKKLVI